MGLKIRQKQAEWLKNNAPEFAEDYLDEALSKMAKRSEGLFSKAVDMNNNEFDGLGQALSAVTDETPTINKDKEKIDMVAGIFDGTVPANTQFVEEAEVAKEVQQITVDITLPEVTVESETVEANVENEDESELDVDNSSETVLEETDVTKNITFADYLQQTVITALKEYHETAVAPLMQKIDELTKSNDELVKQLESKNTAAITKASIFEHTINSDLLPPSAFAAVVKENFSAPEVKGKKVEDSELDEAIVKEIVVEKTNVKKQWYELI